MGPRCISRPIGKARRDRSAHLPRSLRRSSSRGTARPCRGRRCARLSMLSPNDSTKLPCLRNTDAESSRTELDHAARLGTVDASHDWSDIETSRRRKMRKTILTILTAAMLAGASVGAAFAQGAGGGAGWGAGGAGGGGGGGRGGGGGA